MMESPDVQVYQENRDQQDEMEHLESQDNLVMREPQECQETLEHRD